MNDATGGFVLTEEQRAVQAAVARPRGSVMVEAGAGCAKTSTLKAAAPGVRVPALGLAFNRRIADDMQRAVPGNIQVKTMNGLGHAAWGRALPAGVGLVLDDRKTSKIVSGVLRDRKIKLEEDQWDDLRSLVRQAMASGLVPSSCGAAGLAEDTRAGWMQCGAEAGLDTAGVDDVWELAREVLVLDVQQARAGVISFDDQIYCSTMLGGRFPRFPVVLVDEDQDLSPLNIRMLGQSLAPGGRIIAVGDKRQAIYAWRGAAGDSAERIRQLSPGGDWTDLPLLTTFRCPRVVVERQQRHVPGFTAWTGASTGAVVTWQRPAAGPDGQVMWPGWDWGDIAAALPHSRASIAVLCRNNAPLLRFAIKLVRGGIGVQMLGRDIGKGLEHLVHRLCGTGVPPADVPLDQLLGHLSNWRERETAAAAEWPSRVESVNDRADCVQAVAERPGTRTAGDVLRTIGDLFRAESGLVTLSSIHRSKGLEWDCVLHLDPWRVPSKWAREQAKTGNSVALVQEYNLKYVCETRTRHTLLLGSLEDFREN